MRSRIVYPNGEIRTNRRELANAAADFGHSVKIRPQESLQIRLRTLSLRGDVTTRELANTIADLYLNVEMDMKFNRRVANAIADSYLDVDILSVKHVCEPSRLFFSTGRLEPAGARASLARDLTRGRRDAVRDLELGETSDLPSPSARASGGLRALGRAQDSR